MKNLLDFSYLSSMNSYDCDGQWFVQFDYRVQLCGALEKSEGVDYDKLFMNMCDF